MVGAGGSGPSIASTANHAAQTVAMPSEHQGQTAVGRERFPDVAVQIDEDPARFLDRDLVSKPLAKPVADVDEHGYDCQRLVPDDAVSSDRVFVRARIRGIDRIDVLEAWIQVEHALERGPRRKVIEWLRERYLQLEEVGERPDRLTYRSDRS